MKPITEKCNSCNSSNIEKYRKGDCNGEKSYLRCKDCNKIEIIYNNN